MKSIKKALLFGAAIWAVTFLVSVIIFPFHETDRPLFESIMPVALSAAAVLFSYLYLSKVEMYYLREGIFLGITWMLMNILIDLLLFTWGPMKMAISDYFKDIGITYLLIPVITTGMAFLEEKMFNKLIKPVPPAH